jgi:hypothetical protein
MSDIFWLDELSEAEQQNLRNEIKNKIAEGLAIANTDYLLKLIDEHQDNDKIREAWNDNFDQWYEIIKKYDKPENYTDPENDEYVSCEYLFEEGFWGENTTVIDLNAIEKHWQGQSTFSFKNFKFILPVKLTGETELRDFSNAIFSSWAYFDGAKFSFSADFTGAKFSSLADFDGATFESEANFKGAKFSSVAYFKGATFSSRADFKDATFSFMADFKGATFSSRADFTGAKFSSWADFADATFASTIHFQNSEFLNYPPDFTGIKEFKYLPFFDSGPEALAQQFPTQTCQFYPTNNEEGYRKLKIIAKQHENSELEGFFYRRELLCKCYRLEKQGTDQLIRCGIISYERLFSCGWSMIKPIIGLFLAILLFFFAYSYVINDDFLQTTYVDDDNQLRHALILQIKPSVLAFSFKQALPIVSGLDSLGRTYDEMFPQKRLLNKQCEKQEPSKIAAILPQCKIPTVLMILAIIHKISSGILIFMFLLALRNNFKMS